MHFDRLDLRLDQDTRQALPGGAVLVDGIAARTGLYTYHDDKGQPFVELVPASTLFDQRSMDSMAGATFTIRHPDGLVTPDNYQAVAHGAVVKAWQANDTELAVRVRISSADGLAALEDGMVELSPGYQVDVSADPGRSEYGRHDGVQTDRGYNHLSGLWAGEARGGPDMRLQLDGPACAPAGCRVQLARATRHDGDQITMTKIKVSHKDGRTVSLDGGPFGWLTGFKLDAGHADQIETGRVVVEIEGQEPSELVLPVSMIEMLLEGIGAGGPSAAPPAMEETEEVEQVEAVDADDDEPREDGLRLTPKMRAYIDSRIQGRLAAASRTDARDSEVRRHAAALQIDGAGQDWITTAVSAICKANPLLAEKAKRLARTAKTDAVSEGRLRELLETCADAAASASKMVPGAQPRADKTDAVEPWNAPREVH